MTDQKPIIEIKGIGKRYNIAHQQGGYVALRDILANVFRNPFKFAKHKAKQIVGIETNEEFWALKDVNFEVQRGEVIGIIGKNGSGKSTLLKILSGITPPTKGEVHMHGRVASLLEVGTGFHPELTGRENIFLNGAILGMTKKEIARKFDAIVAFSGIEKFLDTPVKHYSSGMYVRLAFSVAAHMEPDILIVDEVLAVGDAEFQKRSMGKMEEVTQKDGRTILFVSHNLDAIQRLCKRSILLEEGRVVEQGETRQVVERYLLKNNKLKTTEWVASKKYGDSYFSPTRMYLGDNKGNVITSEVDNLSEKYIYIEADIEIPDPTVCAAYGLYSESNQVLYWSSQFDANEEYWAKTTAGKNIFRCEVPQRLLNEGMYRIELIVSHQNQPWIIKPNSENPTIFFIINGKMNDSPYPTGPREGLLAPILRWEKFK